MLDNTRLSALSAAVLVAQSNQIADGVKITEMALVFERFLQGVSMPDAPAAAGPKADAPRRGRPPKAATPEPAPEPEEAPVSKRHAAMTKADVGDRVQKLLSANKRQDAAALLKQYGATSVSSLDASKYEAFVEAADALLLSA
jgi:hypothetical protein